MGIIIVFMLKISQEIAERVITKIVGIWRVSEECFEMMQCNGYVSVRLLVYMHYMGTGGVHMKVNTVLMEVPTVIVLHLLTIGQICMTLFTVVLASCW